MKPGCIWRLAIVGVLVLGGILNAGAGDVQAAPPTGVLKRAIHFGISADWLDPATAGFVISSQLPLYLFHDSRWKP